MKFNLLYTTIGLLIVIAWKCPLENQIDRAEWILGTWENKTARGSVFETWKKLNEKEFLGKSYMLQEKDTVLFEEIQLIQDRDSLFYIPTVINQNDGLPVQFTLTSISDSSMLFEHPSHDFPQAIHYVRINKDSLEATISGINNGQLREIVFPMRRTE